MKIAPYQQKLENSEEYRKFQQDNPGAFMIAGFFVIDLETKKNIHQIDYYVPSKRKIAAFTIDGKINLQLLDTVNNRVPEKLDLGTKIDLEALEGILLDEMHNRGMSEEIKKIIAILQNIKGKRIWTLNCVLSGMEILKSKIDDDSETVLKIEKTSFMDLMKKIPMQQAMKKPDKEEDIEVEMDKLNKIEGEIEKEKKALAEELNKKKTADKKAVKKK